jgi:excisionase family DNA binding protein
MSTTENTGHWPKLMTCEQAGEYTNTSERMMRRLAAERRIEIVKVGRHVRIDRATLDQWLTANTRRAV